MKLYYIVHVVPFGIWLKPIFNIYTVRVLKCSLPEHFAIRKIVFVGEKVAYRNLVERVMLNFLHIIDLLLLSFRGLHSFLLLKTKESKVLS